MKIWPLEFNRLYWDTGFKHIFSWFHFQPSLRDYIKSNRTVRSLRSAVLGSYGSHVCIVRQYPGPFDSFVETFSQPTCSLFYLSPSNTCKKSMG